MQVENVLYLQDVFDLHSALLSCKITLPTFNRTPIHQGQQGYSHDLPERPTKFRHPRATLALWLVAMP